MKNFRNCDFDEKYLYIKYIREVLVLLEDIIDLSVGLENDLITKTLENLTNELHHLDENLLYPYIDIKEFDSAEIDGYIIQHEIECKENFIPQDDDFREYYNMYKNGDLEKDTIEYDLLCKFLNEMQRSNFIKRVDILKKKRANKIVYYKIKK